MKVTNMVSNSSGIAVPNQFIMTGSNAEWYQSYNSLIAIRYNTGVTQLDRDTWDYSRTTAKYRNQFLGETTKETQAKIDSGEYQLVDLN